MRERDRGQRQRLEVARERAGQRLARGLAVGVDRGQEADLAEVHGEDRDARPRVAAQRPQDRPVAAERDAELDVVGELARRARGRRLGVSAVLARLLGVEAQDDAVLAAAVDEHRAAPARCPRCGRG